MADLSIKYKDIEIASLSASGTKTLTTKGQYCEDDITVTYTKPEAETFTTEEKTVTPTESVQEVTPTDADALSKVTVNAIDSNYVGSGITRNPTLTVNGATVSVPSGYYTGNVSKTVASGTAGTPSANKGTVSNHSVTITPTVTNTTGYITGGTKTGTVVTVSASELVSGSETKVENGTYDVTNLAEVVVDVPVLDTSDANATSLDIVNGKSAYVNGEKVNGALPIANGNMGLGIVSNAWVRDAELSMGKNEIILTAYVKDRAYLDENRNFYMGLSPSLFGEVQPSSVLAGETFTSSAGLKQEGTLVVNKYYVVNSKPSSASGYNNGDLVLVKG